MSITLNFQGIEVTCDKPEEAMILAGAAANYKPPKTTEIAKLIEKPIKLKIGGVEMVCENPVAAAATLVTAGIVQKPKIYSKDARGAQGKGPQRIWQLSEEYGQKHGISTDESRRLITSRMREYKARLSLDKANKQDDEFLKQLRSLPTGPEYIESSLKK